VVAVIHGSEVPHRARQVALNLAHQVCDANVSATTSRSLRPLELEAVILAAYRAVA
jgi:hypothetical protein